jgi:hypothetical protein
MHDFVRPQAWNGQGRPASKSKKDWQRSLVQKLQAVIFLSLANTDKSSAQAGFDAPYQCFTVAEVLFKDDAIMASLARPKYYDLSISLCRASLETLALIDLAATNSNMKKFSSGILPLPSLGANIKDEEWRETKWPTVVAQLRKRLKENGLLKQDASVSTAALSFYLSALDLVLIAMPLKNEGKAAASAAFNILKGAYELYKNADPSTLVKGVIGMGEVAVKHYRREQARKSIDGILIFARLPALVLEQEIKPVNEHFEELSDHKTSVFHSTNGVRYSPRIVEDMQRAKIQEMCEFHEMHILYLYFKYVSKTKKTKKGKESVPIRWEVAAAFTFALSDIIIRIDVETKYWKSLKLPVNEEKKKGREAFEAFAVWLLKGDDGTNFSGLLGMLEYGLPSSTKKNQVAR